MNATLDCLVQALPALHPGFWQTDPASRNPTTEPSAAALRCVWAGLTAVLAPQQVAASWLGLADGEMDDATLDFFLGQTLACSLQVLRQQVLCELLSSHSQAVALLPTADDEAQATVMLQAFAKRIPILQRRLNRALSSACSHPRAIIGPCLVQEFTAMGAPVLARLLAQLVTVEPGTDVLPATANGEPVVTDPSIEALLRGTGCLEMAKWLI